MNIWCHLFLGSLKRVVASLIFRLKGGQLQIVGSNFPEFVHEKF